MEAEASLHRYGERPDRVTVKGPPLGLNDRAFGVVALLMHEMMTNAAKYGSLSTPTGRLAIEWSVTNTGDCDVFWTESDGPTVVAPESSGFGSKLIHSSVEYDLGGTVTIDYWPTGLIGHFIIPARHVSQPAMTRAVAPQAKNFAPDVLKGLSVLLIEDQALIAMDAEDALMKLGASSVSAHPTVKSAMEALAASRPDFAVLDFNLDGETSGSIASELTRINVPFLFVTGYGDTIMIPDRYKSVPIVRKPISLRDLSEKILITKLGSTA